MNFAYYIHNLTFNSFIYNNKEKCFVCLQAGATSSYLDVKNVACNDLGKNGWNAIHVAIINEMEEIVLFYIEK